MPFVCHSGFNWNGNVKALASHWIFIFREELKGYKNWARQN
ncbi:hypothetical protein [Paenibacillus sp. FSL P4-0184]